LSNDQALGALRGSTTHPLEAVSFEVTRPKESNPARRFLSRSQGRPARVSCLMVTRGDPDIMRFSAACYAKQDWAHRELVAVTSRDRVETVEAVLRAAAAPNVTVIGADSGLTLGELRNIAVARSRGQILMQWDDDDLSDPQRIQICVSALMESGAVAAFLRQWLMWWPGRNLAALSHARAWEGSMAIWREYAPVYPALPRNEDFLAVNHILSQAAIALIQAPLSYVYTITGKNTWDQGHFESLMARSPKVFEGQEYHDLCEMLAARVPIMEYGARLREL
jgi:glycosyltransferase involved in cell wall biosynthesis